MLNENTNNGKPIIDSYTQFKIDSCSLLITMSAVEDCISPTRDTDLHAYLDTVFSLPSAVDWIVEDIKNKLACWRCGGEGKVLLYDGYDAGDYFVPTDSEMCCCPVCGG